MAEVIPREKPTQVDDLVIDCMDNRYHKIIRQKLLDEHDIDVDEVVHLRGAGASMKVNDGSFIPDILAADRLQKVKNVWIFDHTDCGGFGKLRAFDNDERREADAHFESLERATEAIHKVLPQLLVKTFVIGLNGQEIKPAVLSGALQDRSHQA